MNSIIPNTLLEKKKVKEMETDRPLVEEEVIGQYRFDSDLFTVDTLSTGVPEEARIGSDWIVNTASDLRDREEAEESQKKNRIVINVSDFSLTRQKKAKKNRVMSITLILVFFGIVAFAGIAAAVGVSINNSDSEEEEPDDDNDAIPFSGTDPFDLQIICSGILGDIFNFPLNGLNENNFAVCENNQLTTSTGFRCSSGGLLFPFVCQIDEVCACNVGDIIDAREVKDVSGFCVPAADSESAGDCPLLDLFGFDFDFDPFY